MNRQRRRLSKHALERFSDAALAACLRVPAKLPTSLTKLEEIYVVLVSDKRIADLHQRFMRISGPTDVLTFEHGEIVISVDTAARNARTLCTNVEKELELYVVHGLLHLHGFDDRTERKAKRMARTQELVLAEAQSV